MKTICFTNNDLAKAMGLEVGKTYKNKWGEIYTCEMVGSEIRLYGKSKYPYLANVFVDEELTEVEPKPQLTETEITILKGRLAEGYTHLYLYVNTANKKRVRYACDGEEPNHSYAKKTFASLKVGKEYSIEELLKGE
jgi:hypothetical protein